MRPSPSDDQLLVAHLLATTIDESRPDAENKIWSRHPVWFLDANPVVSYSTLKNIVKRKGVLERLV